MQPFLIYDPLLLNPSSFLSYLVPYTLFIGQLLLLSQLTGLIFGSYFLEMLIIVCCMSLQNIGPSFQPLVSYVYFECVLGAVKPLYEHRR